MYDYKLNLVERTPRACPWEQSDHYYLFYNLNGNHTFHSPIDEKEIDEKYSDLDIVKIDRLETFGADIDGLISNQFVCKLIKLIESKDFTLDLN